MAEAEHKKHYLELGIEFCLELAIGLYQLGAEQMDLPHNFWVGLALWIAATALAVRMFWIFPGIGRLNPKLKIGMVAAAIVVLVFIARTPVMTSYRKGRKDSVAVEAAVLPQENKPSVQQNSQGANSPNTTIVGNNNTVNNGDPNISARLDEIARLLKSRGESTSPKTLLAKYPLGYVIFDVDYTNSVFPYQTNVLDGKWVFNWDHVGIKDEGTQNVVITTPDIRSKDGRSSITGNTVGAPKKVGHVTNFFSDGSVVMEIDILAISEKGIVFVIGFDKPKK